MDWGIGGMGVRLGVRVGEVERVDVKTWSWGAWVRRIRGLGSCLGLGPWA